MVLPATTWNHRYTFVASLTSGLVCFLAVVGGTMLLFHERIYADFEADLPPLFLFYSRLGITGIAVVLLSFLAIVGAMFFCERDRIAIPVVLVAGGLSCLYFGSMLLASVGIWFRVTWAVL